MHPCQRLWSALVPSVAPLVSAISIAYIPFGITGVDGFFVVGLCIGAAGFIARSSVPESSNGVLLIASSLFLLGGTLPGIDTDERVVGMGAGFALLWLALKIETEVLRRTPHHPVSSRLRYIVGFQGALASFWLTASVHYAPAGSFWYCSVLGMVITAVLGIVAFRTEQGWGWAPR